ncbi:MAG: ImmA/IrrE family metallo-endopeptidase, partial [Oscillospiraceae bacterium]|nr:ImmA/IrrE family metallo-endopeptidase [Oscillospiraceae bacterium]
MSYVHVDVAPEVIDWVIHSATDVSADVDILDKLIKWQNGEKKPTFSQIESVSKKTRIPLGYFLLQSPPVEDFPVLQYRTIDNMTMQNPSRNLVDTINYVESVQEWMRDYMIDYGYEKMSFIGSCKDEKDKKFIVKNIIETLGITANWHDEVKTKDEAFRFFRRLFEKAGILIMMSGIVGNNTRRSLDIEEFRAFTLLDEYAPLIFINANDSPGAKLFSLLHEATHIWLGENNLYNDRYGNATNVSDIEVLCNAVAAEILVPNEKFRAEWAGITHKNLESGIQIISGIFKCGTIVVARKALDHRYINKSDYKAIVDEAIQRYIE